MGMMGGGFDFGGGGGRGPAAGNPGGGLPFSGVPHEMQAGVALLVENEPEVPEPEDTFTYRHQPMRKRLSLLGLVREEWNLAVWSFALFVATALLTQAGPELIRIGVDHGMRRGQSLTVISVLSLIYIGVLGLNWASIRMQARVTGRLASRIMARLRVRIFTHLQRLDLGFYTDEKAGVILSRMTSDIENLQQLYQDGIGSIAVQVLTMIVIIIVMLTISPWLTLLAVLLIVIPLFVVSIWFRDASAKAYDLVRDGIAKVLADLAENLHGFRTVVANNRQKRNTVKHRNVVGDYRKANRMTAHTNAFYGASTQFIGGIAQGIMLLIGGRAVQHHTISIGDLVAFFLYLNRFYSPIALLVQQYSVFQQSNASIIKLQALLDTEPAVDEAADAYELPPINGEIVFENVTFGYDPAVPVIHDVSFTLRPGETVAFVGQTGAGKSTIAKLVTRFYDPTSGRITIDGHDLREVGVKSLRKQIGVVPQEPFLFAGDIRYNVAFARQEATDEEVWDALRAVGMEDVIERMPDGLDTFVHERGQSLSSGERQLASLARAFHARPRLLVLDEATSNLDLASEAKVEAALDVLLENRTAILIAHRLSTAMKADRICVMHEGRIVEVGSHAQLLRKRGVYADMYATWISHSEVDVA